MIYLVRHGERADYAGVEEQEKIEISFDPHLTPLGGFQAFHAGKEIQTLTKKAYEDKLIKTDKVKYLVVSSPFLRCIQTSYHIIQGLGEENLFEKAIFLENGVCEHLSSSYYSSNPLPELYYRTKLEDLKKKYVNFPLKEGFIEAGKHLFTPNYPESYNEMDKRKEVQRAINDFYANNINKNGDVVLIVVTHGYGVEAFLEYHKVKENYDVRYTCLNQLLYDPKEPTGGKVLQKQYHIHLERADELYEKMQDKKVAVEGN